MKKVEEEKDLGVIIETRFFLDAQIFIKEKKLTQSKQLLRRLSSNLPHLYTYF